MRASSSVTGETVRVLKPLELPTIARSGSRYGRGRPTDAAGFRPRLVGLFGLDRGDASARLGYWLVNRARGRGLATAAVRALIDWAFERLGLDQVVSDREASNVASTRVAQKRGAIETGAHLVECQGAEVALIRHVLLRPPD